MKAIIIYCFFLSVGLISCSDREKKLKKLGNDMIVRIENYKNKHNKLPNSLYDIGIVEKQEGPIFYEKKDSINYIVWFGTDLGESVVYNSQAKEWE